MKLSTFIFSSIALLIKYYSKEYKKEDFHKTIKELEPDLNIPKITTYDFIVVGAGTAGCLIVGKLSDFYKVLLLEAGGTPVPATNTPFLNGYINTHPSINNEFTSIPQRNFAQEINGIITAHTGRMVGGSGSHNGNLYNRGSPHDYNNYAKHTGDDSWSYANVLKHFKNFERFSGNLINESERDVYYGTTGEINTESDWPPILSAWLEVGKELGYGIGDSNGYQKESFTTTVKSMKNGQKSSTYTAFVKPRDFSGSSLTVLRYSLVEKILINGGSKKAYGVAYKRHGIPQIAHASKEVIISCGAFQSPLLLIKSGIGPKATLNEAQIPIIQELERVGQNLRDHGVINLKFDVKNPNTTLLPEISESQVEEEINKFQNMTKSGFFTRKHHSSLLCFIKSKRGKIRGLA